MSSSDKCASGPGHRACETTWAKWLSFLMSSVALVPRRAGGCATLHHPFTFYADSTYFYVTMCVQFISICNHLHGLRLWIFLFFFLLWVLIHFSSIGSHHARSCQQGWSGWGLHLPVFPVKGLHLSPCQTRQCMQRDLYMNSTLIRP